MSIVAQRAAGGDVLRQIAELYGKSVHNRPAMGYRPGRIADLEGRNVAAADNGQLQFHRAPHVVRMVAPGNGWGKTACIAVEIDWWGHGDHPGPADLPRNRPRQLVWIAQKHQQWDLIRRDVERWWPESVAASWVGSPAFRYSWPDGTTLSIITAETDWTTVQGIQPDLVVGDEEVPAQLAREMFKRRRGDCRTRFVFAGTATQGITWVYHDLYMPWKRYHEKRGITDEREMMRRQLHRYDDPALAHLPGIWSWPQGSHRDNPTATAETWAFYLATTTGHAAERAVRLYGGFREFAGQPVFDPDQLELMRATLSAGRIGAMIES